MLWRRMKDLIKDESGGTTSLPFDLLSMIITGYGLVILMAVGASLLHAIGAGYVAIEFGHQAAVDSNMVDPVNGEMIGDELVSAFSKDLPVAHSSVSTTFPPSYGQAGPKQLLVSLVPHNGFVTMTFDYGLLLPIKIPTWTGTAWTTVEPAKIPFHFSMSFYQEWQS